MESNLENKCGVKEADMVLYHGYQIYRDGRIISKSGKEISSYFFTYANSHVSLTINGKTVKKNKAILIYNLFSETPVDTTLYVLRFKDGDSSNASFDNLFLVSRKEYLRTCRETGRGQNRFDEETRDKIRREYEQGESSLREMCGVYKCTLLTIQKIIKSGRKEE